MPILDKNKNNQLNIDPVITNSSWLEIDQKALSHNISSYKAVVNPAKLAVVIKSNAYGHGIKEIAQICDYNSNVDMLCVVSLSEAIFLRNLGIKKNILVLSIIDGDVGRAIEQNIDLIAHDIDFAIEANKVAKSLNKKLNIHIKIDTGLSRLGIPVEEAFEAIKLINNLSNIEIRGIFTHFAESESDNQGFTNLQIGKFEGLVSQLESEGIKIPLKHTACSAAITGNIQSHFNMVRLGIGLYGLWSSLENRALTQKIYPNFQIKPVLTWKTRIIQIKEIKKDSFVGYDRTYQVNRDSKIAVLPVGYWDGYDRRLSNKSHVLINNQLAPVIGRVAMNLTMVDITGLEVSIGAEVILLGNKNGITADDTAKLCHTINYEIVTRINPGLKRVVL